MLYAIEDACDWAWRGPEWLRPAVGGLLLGGLLLVLPEMYGVGYPVLGKAVAGGYGIAFLVALLVGKLVACSLTIGIGGSGGVFAPSLFCGAMAGAVFGDVVHAVAPAAGGSVGAYALVGMGAVFAGAARAPITAVVILFELTGEYTIILPLMLAIVLATGISHLVSPRHRLHPQAAAPRHRHRRARRRHPAPPPGERGHERATGAHTGRCQRALGRRPVRLGAGTLPVADAAGRYLGTIAAHDIMDALASGEDTNVEALTVDTSPLAGAPRSGTRSNNSMPARRGAGARR